MDNSGSDNDDYGCDKNGRGVKEKERTEVEQEEAKGMRWHKEGHLLCSGEGYSMIQYLLTSEESVHPFSRWYSKTRSTDSYESLHG